MPSPRPPWRPVLSLVSRSAGWGGRRGHTRWGGLCLPSPDACRAHGLPSARFPEGLPSPGEPTGPHRAAARWQLPDLCRMRQLLHVEGLPGHWRLQWVLPGASRLLCPGSQASGWVCVHTAEGRGDAPHGCPPLGLRVHFNTHEPRLRHTNALTKFLTLSLSCPRHHVVCSSWLECHTHSGKTLTKRGWYNCRNIWQNRLYGKSITREKEGPFVKTKAPIHQGDIAVLNSRASNTSMTKYIKQNLVYQKWTGPASRKSV